MENSAPARHKLVVGREGFALVTCGVMAVVVASLEAFAPHLAPLPGLSALLTIGLSGVAIWLRELSVRRQFQNQSDRLVASLDNIRDQNHLLVMTELSANVGHWRLDFSSDRIFWSDGTYKIHGLEPGSTPSLEQAISYYHPDDLPTIVEHVERARNTGAAYDVSARLVRPSGELRYIVCRGQVERDKQGNPAYLFGMIHDRTEEELARQELRRTSEEACALAQSKGQFLARMSHEIRTPMNGVLGFAELLNRSDLTPEQQRHSDLIIESGKSLQMLLDDILDLTKIEAGKLEIKPTTVDLRHLVHRVSQLAEVSAREKNIEMNYHATPDLPRFVELDGLRLRQILSNLLSNAVRFTDQGGVSISVCCSDDRLRISVADTGTGISPDMLEQIFDPFTQESQDAASSRGGTGLGLAICQQLAELMGGTLSVSSELGKGSEFELSLPLVIAAAPSQSEACRPLPFVSMGNRKARVLLAEDYAINRELIMEMMRRLDIEVECAEDGLEAVKMACDARDRGKPYALILMDLQMPRLNGIAATRRIREEGNSEDELPIIALTANAFADDIALCLAAGMQSHLAKPISFDQLADTLARWLPDSEVPNARILSQVNAR